MKAILSEEGALIIIPETPLETYALTQWRLGWRNRDGFPRSSTLRVDTEIMVPDQGPHPLPTLSVPPTAFPNCTRNLQAAGVAYPRTCKECGLGPCKDPSWPNG